MLLFPSLFTYPFRIILSEVTIKSLLLIALNADQAADHEDLVIFLTLYDADKSTVHLYYVTIFWLISSHSRYSIVYHLFSLSNLMIWPTWLNWLNFFCIVVPIEYICISSLIGAMPTLGIWQVVWGATGTTLSWRWFVWGC